MPDHNPLRQHFLLDPDVIFLNHGSFGACPMPVFEEYQRWQRELERQPVDFFTRRVIDLLRDARTELAAYLHADPDNLIFVTNATVGVNIVAHALELGPGDEILTTDHEYGALDRMWELIARKTGARYVHHPIPIPVPSAEEVVDSFWEAITSRTRIIFMSHITSPTALILPVAEICRHARKAGILTIIDGAHTPGQIPLDLGALGADFYAGNCHKWLCAPKGSGFLYARPERQHLLEPLIVSWELEDESDFVRRVQWQGTRDPAAFLAVPAAIEFQHEHNWDAVRAECHTLAGETLQRLVDWSGLPSIAPDSWFAQMAAAPLPACDAQALHERLYAERRIEVPVIEWNDKQFVRFSVQGYNTPDDPDCLVAALAELLPR